MSQPDIKRAEYFQLHGVKPLDSFHLAVAESAGVDVFLTTDRKFLNAAARLEPGVKIANPAEWIMEAINSEW
jgi:predicted nucleic acid-binding protein